MFSKDFFHLALSYYVLGGGAFILLMYYNLYPLLTGLLINAFLLHIFILNNWLPFQLIPLNPQDKPEKAG
jgi:hypothetical protein